MPLIPGLLDMVQQSPDRKTNTRRIHSMPYRYTLYFWWHIHVLCRLHKQLSKLHFKHTALDKTFHVSAWQCEFGTLLNDHRRVAVSRICWPRCTYIWWTKRIRAQKFQTALTYAIHITHSIKYQHPSFMLAVMELFAVSQGWHRVVTCATCERIRVAQRVTRAQCRSKHDFTI